jgi:hypothetical protein
MDFKSEKNESSHIHMLLNSSMFVMTTQLNFDNNKGLNYGLMYARLQKRRHTQHIQNLQRNFVCHGHWEEKTRKIRGVYGCRIGRQIVKSVCLHHLPKGHGHVKYHRIPWPRIVH